MGGGFAVPPIIIATSHRKYKAEYKQLVIIEAQSQTQPGAFVPMHEKLMEKDEIRTEKTDTLKLLGEDKSRNKDKNKDKNKPKESKGKFTERLRRSFRRNEHKSLETKRQEPPGSGQLDAKSRRATPPPPAISTASPLNNNILERPLTQQSSRTSLFSLTRPQLPGLSLGGHINPALLLDSPDECTPPEYAYQHLSSVATTNSSTSLESNFEYPSELGGSQSSVYYWASGAPMGGEVSTAAGSGSGSGSGNATNGAYPCETQERTKRRLETQRSNRSDQQTNPSAGGNTHVSASRSCSLTSDSSSMKLTRLQNFLFKSSNESSRSYQGHSNEGFSAFTSSYNSSSGEWEQLGAHGQISSSGGMLDLPAGSFAEESMPEEADGNCSSELPVESGEVGNYYQYTLTSPNNPFLPEITARTYHSIYDDGLQEESGEQLEELPLDGNITSVKYVCPGGGTRSAQLPTPSYSRAGSQESTHSESGLSWPGGPTTSPASSSSSTPGRQRRKLFSLNSPTRLLHHQHPAQPQAASQPPPSHQQKAHNMSAAGMPSAVTMEGKSASSSFVHSLNPFLPVASIGSSSLPPKRVPLKQAAITSPVAPTVPSDLNAKREEFLRATMKICLVVSPPTGKLQLKSKSLTNLDGIDPALAYQQNTSATSTATTTACATATAVTSLSAATATSPGRQVNANEKNGHVHLIPRPPTIYTQALQQQQQQQPPQQQQQQLQQQQQQQQEQQHQASAMLSPRLGTSVDASTCCHGGSNACQSSSHQASASTTTTMSTTMMMMTTAGAATPTTAHLVASKYAQGQGSGEANSLSPALSHKPGACSGGNGGSAGSGASGGADGRGGGAITPITIAAKKKPSFLQRKKPLLTRSEVSSLEFFSVCFPTGPEKLMSQQQDEELIPATKGVTLQNALSQALRRRNLSFSQIIITDHFGTPALLDADYVGTGCAPLSTVLDEHTDVENLAGHQLIIRERDGGRKTLQKAASFGSRQRPSRLLSSASTEEPSDSSNATSKQIRPILSAIFGIKNPQQTKLCELLNSYARNGVPQRQGSGSLNFEHAALSAALSYLDNMDKSWRELVDSTGMTESEIKIQTAIWELVTTEVYYIHALQTVTDLFLACLEAVQNEQLLTDVDQHRLFSNVRSVCQANIMFWTLWLYPMVAYSRDTREPLQFGFFQEGFNSFATIFAPYKIYCAEQSTCQFYCKELNQNNALFTSYLAWCESQKKCDRLRLADIVVRPMQRLTKYSLLLTAIKKHMTDAKEIEAIDTMIHSVESFVGSVNNHLTLRQESERLKGVMARIESYDVVDTNNEMLDKLVRQHSQMFDLCAPMRGCPAHHVRHLFMEGDHRFKDNLGKLDVHCFLLTDMLLVCKTIAKKGQGTLKIIRQPYLTDHLIVQLQPNNALNCVYLNEYQVATTAFTLLCNEAKNWYDALWRAKTIYQRLKRGVGGLAGDSFRFGGSGASGGTADSLGVRKSPMNSSLCSHVSSTNNSHSGSVEWNDSRNISIDFEKTNSLSSDEGLIMGNQASGGGGTAAGCKAKQQLISGAHKPKIATIGSASVNTLAVQPLSHLGQSLPNLNLHHSHTNNTLLVPGTTSSHSGNLLLSPSHRGISYPPPSPTRVPLRRGMAFSTSTKNPPLLKTRNITSQNSINWHQIPATPTPPSPQSQHQSPAANTDAIGNLQKSLPALVTLNSDFEIAIGTADNIQYGTSPLLQKQLSHQTSAIRSPSNQNLLDIQQPAFSNETDV